VQLKHYDARCAEIRKAMDYFWDLLEGVPGLRAHRPPKGSGSNMGGWYAARGLYVAEELGGLSVTRFAQAVRAEGSICNPGCNVPLHLHPIFNTADVYGDGKPTRIAHTGRDVRQPACDRKRSRAHLQRPVVQALPPGDPPGVRRGFPQVGGELSRFARRRHRQPRLAGRLAFLQSSLDPDLPNERRGIA
jgi:hypothetical protein